jgi:hypothetical protein
MRVYTTQLRGYTTQFISVAKTTPIWGRGSDTVLEAWKARSDLLYKPANVALTS